ncbi:MAG: hypothetical protein ACD_37C00101G0005 [uncultured bacterium]|nr:MAG: hypothetical protein ACD_37C00101G0005 [uncultured bacterium]
MSIDKDGMSLKEFINENHSLLSAMAIFATIAALLGNLPIRWMGIVLSFISIAGIVIIWHEIKSQLPEKMSPKLFIFRYILLWGLGALIFYWLLEFRDIWHVFLFVPLTILFMYVIISTIQPIREWKIIRYVFGIGKEKNRFQKALKILVIAVVAYSSLYLAALFSVPINVILDGIKNAFR